MKSNKINTRQLRLSLDQILNEFEEIYREEVVVPEDFYWKIPIDSVFNINEQPHEMEIGSISEDLARLNRLIEVKGEISIAYDLIIVGQLIQAIYLYKTPKSEL